MTGHLVAEQEETEQEETEQAETEQEEAVYVKFNGFISSVTAGNGADLYYGGLVANAGDSFVDAYNVTLSTSVNYHGGGAVGYMENGVLRLSGYTTFSGNGAVNVADAYDEGQIVGHREDSLIFAEKNWVLNRGKKLQVITLLQQRNNLVMRQLSMLMKHRILFQ